LIDQQDRKSVRILPAKMLGAARRKDGYRYLVLSVDFTEHYKAMKLPDLLADPWNEILLREVEGRGWAYVWGFPVALVEFIKNTPVGETGKASNRVVEIIDYEDGDVVVNQLTGWDTWVSY
jgi:hypothetical protein